MHTRCSMTPLLKQGLAALKNGFNIRTASHDTCISGEIAAEVQMHLDRRCAQINHWLLLVRSVLAIGTAGFLFVESVLSSSAITPFIWLLLGYAAANGAVSIIGSRALRLVPWLFAGLDVTFTLLLRHGQALGLPMTPNPTLVGLLALVLLTYTLYGKPKLSATLALVSLLAAAASIQFSAPEAVSTALAGGPLHTFLLVEYLSIACLITCLLALRLHRRTMQHYVELHRRIEAAADSAVEQRRREQLEEVDNLKRNFIAVLSHELRNPITPLSTALDVIHEELKAGRQDADLVEVLDIAVESAGQLRQLIHDYTELAELLVRAREDEPRWNLHLAPLLATLTEHAPALRFVISDLDGLAASGDPFLLRGALRAVLRRAELRTPGDRHISVSGTHQDGHVTVAIHDPTSYLAPETAEALKDPFASSSERIYASSNTGLELTLAQHALHRIGGTLHIESAPEMGTVVHCRLPAAHPDRDWLDERQLRSSLFQQPGVVRTAH